MAGYRPLVALVALLLIVPAAIAVDTARPTISEASPDQPVGSTHILRTPGMFLLNEEIDALCTFPGPFRLLPRVPYTGPLLYQVRRQAEEEADAEADEYRLYRGKPEAFYVDLDGQPPLEVAVLFSWVSLGSELFELTLYASGEKEYQALGIISETEGNRFIGQIGASRISGASGCEIVIVAPFVCNWTFPHPLEVRIYRLQEGKIREVLRESLIHQGVNSDRFIEIEKCGNGKLVFRQVDRTWQDCDNRGPTSYYFTLVRREVARITYTWDGRSFVKRSETLEDIRSPG